MTRKVFKQKDNSVNIKSLTRERTELYAIEYITAGLGFMNC